ncbi:MAG: hypothetical protein NT018_13750 [Armatimonadetes bacterium]|nr:hypothetical protein [Armatimonadota bacterium]
MTAFGATTFGYGADGLRAWKKVGEGDKRYFLYSGGMPVCEMDSSGNVVAINTFGPTGLISRDEGENHYFYTFDPLGNVSQIQDDSGDVVANVGYYAYGTPLAESESNPTPFGCGGQAGYYTDESGLILCSYRYYDPTEGRWLTRDPIGYDGGINVYAYCGGNPVGRLDPSGLAWYDGWLNGEWGSKVPVLGGMAQQAGCDYAKCEMGKGSGWQAAWSCGKAGVAIVGGSVVLVAGGEIAAGVGTAYDVALGAYVSVNTAGASALGAISGVVGGIVNRARGLRDPFSIRFSQNTCSYSFRNPAYGNIDDLAGSLRNGSITARQIDPIRLVNSGEDLYTLDNRRLEAFRRAGVAIRARMATPEEITNNEGWKFTTTNGGTSIRVRGQ